MTDAIRKPRIALMGEFSAGKSTLSNLLLGTRPLPEKVTATRLSPVWMSHGTEAPYRIDIDGNEEPVELTNLESIDVEATRVIRLFFDADILQVCDLIDFPGISDPNMSSEVWQRVSSEVDAVLWCTHATQAWRQSEAAVWETFPEAVREQSVLLVTRFDKLTTERDKFRVLARLEKETKGLFGATFPVSLTEALAAGDDYEAFTRSGGGAFLEHLVPLIDKLAVTVGAMETSIFESATSDVAAEVHPVETNPSDALEAQPNSTSEIQDNTVEDAPAPVAFERPDPSAPVVPVDSSEPVVRVETTTSVAEESEGKATIIPRRVRPKPGSSSQRPGRPVATDQVISMDNPMLAAAYSPLPHAGGAQLRSVFQDGDTDDIIFNASADERKGKATAS